MSVYNRFRSEMVSGGEDLRREAAGGWRGALGLLGIAALFVWLALVNPWWFVFVLGVLVIVFLHELGHFMTARWTGMKATEFFIGFGPRLWSFHRGETEYGVRALPLGAFVRIIGMSRMDEIDPAEEHRTYRAQSYPRRILVITAGSAMHMILAILLLFGVYLLDGETVADRGAWISRVVAASPAEAAGLREGDVVLALDGQGIATAAELGELIRTRRPGDLVLLTVEREGAEQDITVGLGANTDQSSALFGSAYLGIGYGTRLRTIDHAAPGAALNAVTDVVPLAWDSVKGVVQVMNPLNVATHLTGSNTDLATRPTTLVGITGLSDDVAESRGVTGLMELFAVLNVFVGVFNMFPLLPLDGGHAAIATYERLRERRGQRYYADVAKLVPVATAVIMLLLFLFASGLYLDITDPVGG